MEHDEIKLTIIELYEKNQARLSGNKKYKFDLTDKRNDLLDSFIEKVSKRIDVIGIDILKSYMIYAFGTYAGRGYKGNPTTFPATWLISYTLFLKFLSDKSGKKYAVKKNLQRQRKKLIKIGRDVGEGKRRVKVEGFLKETETEFERLERKKEQKRIMNEVDELEEKEKERFHNKLKGRLWCVDFTTLYNDKSYWCKKCKFKEGCINTLKEYLPNIYKLRNG